MYFLPEMDFGLRPTVNTKENLQKLKDLIFHNNSILLWR